LQFKKIIYSGGGCFVKKTASANICSGSFLKDACGDGDFQWHFTMPVSINASENRFKTASTNVLCTSVTLCTAVAVLAVAWSWSPPPSFLEKRFSRLNYAISACLAAFISTTIHMCWSRLV